MFSSVQLLEGQTFLLAPPDESHQCIQLSMFKGIARVSGSFGNNFTDITLAFCGEEEKNWICLPDESTLLLEAMTDSSIKMHYESNCPLHKDLMTQWLFDLHLVRHPIGAEARLVSLFQLLVNRFGIRRGDGYLLPFSLGHARIAELIGATRSTVTRQITILKQQNDLHVNNIQGQFFFSTRLIESSLK